MLQLKRELRPRQWFIHRLEKERAWTKSIVFTSDHAVNPSTPTMHQVSGWSERSGGAGWSRFHSAECIGAPVSETPRQMSISDSVCSCGYLHHQSHKSCSSILYTSAGSCYMFSGCMQHGTVLFFIGALGECLCCAGCWLIVLENLHKVTSFGRVVENPTRDIVS